MEAAASIIAFVQVAGKIAELIFEVSKLWGEAKGLPQDLQDLLEELDIFALQFEELKEQLDYEQASGPSRSKSSINRSFVAATKAQNVLQGLVEEINSEIRSKKEGFQRTMVALKSLLKKKDRLESHQKRLKRVIDLLHIAISIRHMAMTRQNADIIASRMQNDLKQQIADFQPQIVSMVHMTIQNEQRLINNQHSTQLISTKTLAKDTNSKSQNRQPWLIYSTKLKTWQARVQFPNWLSQAVHDIQFNRTFSSWSLACQSYSVISRESEIIHTIERGDKKGVLKLFDDRMASPFDKDEHGNSLLYFAAQNKQYEICQVLLKLGLKVSLTEVVGTRRESPLKPLVYEPDRKIPESEWNRIVELFQAYLQDGDEVPVIRLCDFIHEWAYGDEFMLIFRDRFMPKYYHWPIRDRLEAVRLGSFRFRTYASFARLLSKDSVITSSDVAQSSDEKLSLLHSAAIGLAIRFPDETIPRKRAEFQWRIYNNGWRELVTEIASVAASADLHNVELVSPWDVYHVSHWRGTPLISVIGGALCYLSPEISFVHWNNSIHATMHEWLEGLRLAGVDLAEYGKKERIILHGHLKGAFDADAIEASRTMIRESVARGTYNTKDSSIVREGWNVNHWIPIRIIDVVTGPNVEDWRIMWAPEFEYMAKQFWDLVDVRDEKSVMPGSWFED